MNLNEPITSTTNNYGLTCLVAGVLQVIFGFSVSFVGIIILAVTLWAGVKSFQTEKADASRILKAKVGLALVVIMIVLYFLGVEPNGLVMPFMNSIL